MPTKILTTFQGHNMITNTKLKRKLKFLRSVFISDSSLVNFPETGRSQLRR